MILLNLLNDLIVIKFMKDISFLSKNIELYAALTFSGKAVQRLQIQGIKESFRM